MTVKRKIEVTDESDQEHSAEKENIPKSPKAAKSRKKDKTTDESDQEQSTKSSKSKGLKSRDLNKIVQEKQQLTSATSRDG
jgi:hypothetical protein